MPAQLSPSAVLVAGGVQLSTAAPHSIQPHSQVPSPPSQVPLSYCDALYGPTSFHSFDILGPVPPNRPPPLTATQIRPITEVRTRLHPDDFLSSHALNSDPTFAVHLEILVHAALALSIPSGLPPYVAAIDPPMEYPPSPSQPPPLSLGSILVPSSSPPISSPPTSRLDQRAHSIVLTKMLARQDPAFNRSEFPSPPHSSSCSSTYLLIYSSHFLRPRSPRFSFPHRPSDSHRRAHHAHSACRALSQRYRGTSSIASCLILFPI